LLYGPSAGIYTTVPDFWMRGEGDEEEPVPGPQRDAVPLERALESITRAERPAVSDVNEPSS
jgi:hypothetical protein